MMPALSLLMCMCFFIILTVEVSPKGVIDEENMPTSLISYDLRINQADTQFLCPKSVYVKMKQLLCNKGEPLLDSGYFATYNEKTKTVSLLDCLYFQSEYYIYSKYHGHKNYILIQLPKNLSQLNDYMCGPLNRKSLVCSECADGFGPSVTSLGYQCVNCSEARYYAVPLFFFLEFFPITIFYLVFLAFHISVTSAPMPCFIMFAQIMVVVFDSAHPVTPILQKMLPKEAWDQRMDIKVMLLLYRVFNLEFGHYLLPPYCLSSKLKFIHVAYLGYISAFYPLILICITWVCIELHGRNFRPLVWLWRPFHKCFVRLRRGWNTKSDIIDVFTTFFLLSYGKIMYQTLLLLSFDQITNVNDSGHLFITKHCTIDQSIPYGSTYHLFFAIPSILVCLVFNILLPLLLVLYPIKAFQSCLSKCHLNPIALNIFIERIHGCYRNGLDGGQDMRSFSGFYFLLRIVPYLVTVMTFWSSAIYNWFYSGTLFIVATIIIALAKPYQKASKNYLDILLLLDLALLCYSVLIGTRTSRVLFALPILVLILVTVISILDHAIRNLSKCACIKLTSQKLMSLRAAIFLRAAKQGSATDTETARQPLIQSTSTVFSYGTLTINN